MPSHLLDDESRVTQLEMRQMSEIREKIVRVNRARHPLKSSTKGKSRKLGYGRKLLFLVRHSPRSQVFLHRLRYALPAASAIGPRRV